MIIQGSPVFECSTDRTGDRWTGTPEDRRTVGFVWQVSAVYSSITPSTGRDAASLVTTHQLPLIASCCSVTQGLVRQVTTLNRAIASHGSWNTGAVCTCPLVQSTTWKIHYKTWAMVAANENLPQSISSVKSLHWGTPSHLYWKGMQSPHSHRYSVEAQTGLMLQPNSSDMSGHWGFPSHL